MAYGTLQPAEGAPAMWTLDITTFRGLAFGARHYYAKIEGPDRTVHIMYVITEADLEHLNPKDGDRVGMPTERFPTIDDATAAGMAAFASVAGPDDILVPGGPTVEWPLSGPESVLREAAALRERDLLTTWLQALGRYRQWYPLGTREDQNVVVERTGPAAEGAATGWAVVDEGRLY
jgi:hypothetical protein